MAINLSIGDALKIKMKNKKIIRKQIIKTEKFDGICYHCIQKGHISIDCRAQKNGYYKKFEKAERPLMDMRTIWCYVC